MEKRLKVEDFNLIKYHSKIFYIGSEWDSNNYGKFNIVGKVGRKKFIIQFMDETVISSCSESIRRGTVKNPYHPSCYGLGFLGQGDKKYCINYKKTREGALWNGMFSRCYSKACHKNQPTYKECIIDKRWYNFQIFCEDIKQLEGYKKWKESNNNIEKWELDKDSLCEELYIFPKIYSFKTCKFLLKKENNTIKGLKLSGLNYIATRLSDGYKEEFINQSLFARKWNMNYSCLSDCLHGRQKTHKGWYFKIK